MSVRFSPAVLVLLAILISAPAFSQSIAGKAQIVSGDIIEINRRHIRLFGIAAPLPGQICTAKGKPWACGQNATFALSAIVERQWVHCKTSGPAKGRTIVAVCRLAGADGPDIGAAIVRQGWALADRRQSNNYVEDEDHARKARAGIWVGDFAAPWKVKRKSRPSSGASR